MLDLFKKILFCKRKGEKLSASDFVSIFIEEGVGIFEKNATLTFFCLVFTMVVFYSLYLLGSWLWNCSPFLGVLVPLIIINIIFVFQIEILSTCYAFLRIVWGCILFLIACMIVVLLSPVFIYRWIRRCVNNN